MDANGEYSSTATSSDAAAHAILSFHGMVQRVLRGSSSECGTQAVRRLGHDGKQCVSSCCWTRAEEMSRDTVMAKGGRYGAVAGGVRVCGKKGRRRQLQENACANVSTR